MAMFVGMFIGAHISKKEFDEALFWILDARFDLCAEFRSIYLDDFTVGREVCSILYGVSNGSPRAFSRSFIEEGLILRIFRIDV
jgi:hypothetical protein